MKFKALLKAIKDGSYKSFNVEQRWEAHQSINRKNEEVQTMRAALCVKTLTRAVMLSGRSVGIPESGRVARMSETVAREHDRLLMAQRAYGLVGSGGWVAKNAQ